MEGTVEKNCPQCGEKLPDDAYFCVKCGTRVDGEMKSVEKPVEDPGSCKKKKKKIGKVVAVVIAVALVLFVVNAIQAFGLKKELMRDWETIDGDGDAEILKILDFSDDEIEYSLETGYAWLDCTVATFEYKVISRNKMKVNRFGDSWETITVEFSDDKVVMTVSPALTSVDVDEQWFNFD